MRSELSPFYTSKYCTVLRWPSPKYSRRLAQNGGNEPKYKTDYFTCRFRKTSIRKPMDSYYFICRLGKSAFSFCCVIDRVSSAPMSSYCVVLAPGCTSAWGPGRSLLPLTSVWPWGWLPGLETLFPTYIIPGVPWFSGASLGYHRGPLVRS